MSIENAKQKLSEAIYAMKVARVGVVHGPRATDLALAVGVAETAEVLLCAAERAGEAGGTSEAPPSGVASTNPGA